jgi:hypothetical protein
MLPQFLGTDVELRAEVAYLVPQTLNQHFTIYLSLTSSLRPAVVQPHPDATVLPIRAQGTSSYPLPHGVGADTEFLRRLPYIYPATSHSSRLRPVKRPSSVRCMVAGLKRARIGALDVVPGPEQAPTLAGAEEAVRGDPRGSQERQITDLSTDT